MGGKKFSFKWYYIYCHVVEIQCRYGVSVLQLFKIENRFSADFQDFVSSVVRIGSEVGSDVARVVVVVVLQGVAGAHGHIGVEVCCAEIAAGVG